MRRLDLETSIDWLMPADLQAFPNLEILRLCCPSQYAESADLDLSSAQSLRRLHIENWAPRIMMVPAGCEVHALWTRMGWEKGRTRDWLESPCWRAPGFKLAVLMVKEAWEPYKTDLRVHHIHRIVECHNELMSLEMGSQRLGSETAPLTFSTEYIKRRSSPLRVSICTDKGCWLYVDEAIQSHKNLALKIEGPLHKAQRPPPARAMIILIHESPGRMRQL